MKRKNSESFFVREEAAEPASSTDIVRFRNAQDSGPALLYNKSQTRPYLIRDVSIKEIESLVISAEREVIRLYWETQVLAVVEGKLRGLQPILHPSGKKEFPVNRRCLAMALLGYLPADPIEVTGSFTSQERDAYLGFLAVSREEQLSFLRKNEPTNLRELTSWVYRCSKRIGWSCAPSAHGITDPKIWLGHLAASIASEKSGGVFSLLLAIRLRQAGIVLWPYSTVVKWSHTRSAYRTAMAKHKHDGYPEIYGFISNEYYRDIARRLPLFHKREPADAGHRAFLGFQEEQNRIARVYFSSTIEAENECSWEFAEGVSSYELTRRAGYAPWSIALKALAQKHDLHGHHKVSSESPWLRFIREYIGDARRSEFEPWMKVFTAFYNDVVKARGIKHQGGHAGNLKPFINWLKDRADAEGRLLLPLEITRLHLWADGPTQFLTFKAGILEIPIKALQPTRQHNRYLQAARELFLHLQSENPNYKLPLYSTDKFKAGSHNKSVRGRVPGLLLRDIREFIVTRKDPNMPPHSWSEAVRGLPFCQQDLMIAGKVETVFCPVMPAILWLLAQWPLRSSQVLWLDSGELDENRYDFNKRSFVRNVGGIKDREAGVIAMADDDTQVGDGFGPDHHLDFRVIRNKRLMSERSEYTIPYMDADTLWVLRQVVDWQEKYGGAPVLVKENQQQRNDQNQEGPSPEIVALFRIPNNQSKFPPRLAQLRRFWHAFGKCYDAQNRFNDNRFLLLGSETTTSVESTVHGKPRVQNHTVIKMVYDLHSLRVGGVSDLLDRGIPLALVAAIAGHRSLAMTLYYYKADRAKMRADMSKILKGNPSYVNQIAQVDKLLRAMDETAIAGLSGNISVLRQKLAEKQTVVVTSRGICPGTSCEEGLKSVNMQGGIIGTVVPDRLCPLCQFWIIGQMFLPGMAKWMNELLEELEMASKRQERLYLEMKELDAKGRSEESLQRRNEQELLERACVPKGAAVASLYQMIMKLCRDGDQQTKMSATPLGLVIAGGDSVRPQLQGMGRFEKIHEMQLLDHMLPWQTSNVGEKVTYEHTLNLMAALRDHGAVKFFVGLPRELHRTANIALGELMMKVVPTVETLESVYQGQKLLTDVLDGMDGESLEEAFRNLDRNLKAASTAVLEGDPADLLLPPRQPLLSN